MPGHNKGHFERMKRAALIPWLGPSRAELRRPLWRSLSEAIAWQIDLGQLRAGHRLPSARTLAQHLGLSRLTVSLAYERLMAGGYLRARVGDGTYVRSHDRRGSPPVWRRDRRWMRDPDNLAIALIADTGSDRSPKTFPDTLKSPSK